MGTALRLPHSPPDLGALLLAWHVQSVKQQLGWSLWKTLSHHCCSPRPSSGPSFAQSKSQGPQWMSRACLSSTSPLPSTGLSLALATAHECPGVFQRACALHQEIAPERRFADLQHHPIGSGQADLGCKPSLAGRSPSSSPTTH